MATATSQERDAIAAVLAAGHMRIKVTPRSSRDRVVWALPPTVTRVYVTVVPEEGKANNAIIKLLAKALSLAPTRLMIQQGLANQNKTIAIRPVSG